MSDALEIQNLLEKDHSSTASELQYSETNMLYFNDMNNGNYNSGQIRFDTVLAANDWVDWADSQLMIPLTIKSSNNGTYPYGETDPIAFKNSTLSLITGIQVVAANGSTIVPQCRTLEQSLVRAMVESSSETPKTSLESLQLWKSELPNIMASTGAAGGYYFSQTSTLGNNLTSVIYNNNSVQYATGASSTITTVNNGYNPGFAKGVEYFKANANLKASTTDTFETTVFIPLKYIHPLFAQLDEPLLGTRFYFTFYTSVTASYNNIASATVITNDCPMVVGATNSAGTAMVAPVIAIGNAASSTCKIYYKQCKFTSDIAEKMAQRYKEGFTKTINYLQPDVYTNINGRTNWPAGNPSLLITDSQTIPTTIRPRRVWQLMYPTGMSSSFTIPFCSVGALQNVQFLLSNVPYFKQPLVYDVECWWKLKQEMPNIIDPIRESSFLTYEDFVTQYRFYCYDITRVNNVQLELAGVPLAPQWQRKDGYNVDLTYIVEKEIITKWTFNDNGVTVVLA